MPSPFPGMDPYLEGSEWSSVHVALSAEMARQLAPTYTLKPQQATSEPFDWKGQDSASNSAL